jgi:hypothetical protein
LTDAVSLLRRQSSTRGPGPSDTEYEEIRYRDRHGRAIRERTMTAEEIMRLRGAWRTA